MTLTGERSAGVVSLTDHATKPWLVECVIRTTDPDWVGRRATLKLERVVHVKDSRPVHHRSVLWETTLVLERGEQRFVIPRARLGRGYDYRGHQIDMRLESKLEIDDGLLFDTELEGVHRVGILDRPRIDGAAKELAEPSDAFDFVANLAAIPAGSQALVLLLGLVGTLVMLANLALGIHDQFSPEAQTILYSHYDSDGDSQSPLIAALVGSGFLGFLVWLAIRKQLRKYMTFRLAADIPPLEPSTVIPAARLVRGRPRVPLTGATLRVVAYNREHGQYVRGSGTNQRTVSFSTPVRAVVLFERAIPDLPAGVPLASALEGEVAFRELFAALYPPCKPSSTHGVDVCWEVQLLHPLFVDQEIVCEANDLSYERFLDA